MKKLIILITTILIATFALSTATYASTNSKADAAYKKEIKKFSKTVKRTWYKLVDITGDGVHEAIVSGKAKEGSGYILKIYTYKNGKVKELFEHRGYGVEKIVAYKKAKSFYYHKIGHGSEAYVWHQLKNGKYQEVCGRGRAQMGDTSWKYSTPQKGITKSEYKKLVNSLAKGSVKRIYPWK